MNRVAYGVLITIIVLLAGVLAWKSIQKPAPAPNPVVVVRLFEDRTKIDSLAKEIWGLNARIDSSAVAAQKYRRQVVVQKKELEVLKAFKDSAEMAYNELKTIERCDSLVQAQRAVIIEQDTILMALEAEAIEYSNQAALLEIKTGLQDKVIEEKDSTIKTLQCAYNWKIENRFWAWVFGWKCNQPTDLK